MAGLTGLLPTSAQALALRVGVPSFQPDVYLDTGGHINGIQGAIVTEIARRERWILKPQACAWAECLRLLLAGSVDLLPDVTYTPERTKILSFHQTPVLFRSFQFFTRNGVALNSLSDLAGKRLAVLSGAAQQEMVGSILARQHIDAQMVPIGQLSQGFGLVQAGQADAVLADGFVGALEASKHHLVPAPVMLPTAAIFFATAHGRHPEVLAGIDHYLNAWKADPDSVYFKILAGQGYPPPTQALRWYSNPTFTALAVLLLVMTGLLIWHKGRRAHSPREPLPDFQTNPTRGAEIATIAPLQALPAAMADQPERSMLIARVE